MLLTLKVVTVNFGSKNRGKRERGTDRQTDRRTETKTERQRDRQTQTDSRRGMNK